MKFHSNRRLPWLVMATVASSWSCVSKDNEVVGTETASVATEFESDDTDVDAEDTDVEAEDTVVEAEDTVVEAEDTDVDPSVPQPNPPVIQTPSPLIHLADNLDEQDQLGWCIDTRGNGFAENLHAHSCKASGGDVQFVYDAATLQICSVPFPDFCVEMAEGVAEGMSLSLLASNPSSPAQRFLYDPTTGEFNPEADPELCLAAGDTSRAAGIYMSRSLTLERSSETEARLRTWVIVSM